MNPFGVDIKSIVGSTFKGELDTLTYTAIETTYDPVAGTETTTTTDYTFDGIVDDYSAYEQQNNLIEGGDKKVIAIADSLDVTPEQDDKIEGYKIINIDPDPSGAMYEIQVR